MPTVVSQPVSVSGLGGIGKTELVKKYVEKYSQDYVNNVIWIDPETYERIKESFQRVARKSFGINNIKRENIGPIIRNIYAFFAEKKVYLFLTMQKNLEMRVKMLALVNSYCLNFYHLIINVVF